MMLISPEIYSNPYTEKEFVEMSEKLDNICFKNFSNNYIIILQKELLHCSDHELLLTETVCERLKDNMQSYANISPCADAFYNSIFKELFQTFKNQPLNSVHEFLEKLTLLSKK